MIPKETIDTIFETARIEEVVGDFIHLKKRGANLLGVCPFHDEKTPSFTVSPVKGIYKCFGCSKGGNSVNFVMDHEQFTYPQALRYLAKKYNIEVEEEEQTPEQIAKANAKESLFVVSNYANTYFQEQLHNSQEGKAIGLSYFKERRVSPEMIKMFQLGYNPEAWDAFTKSALKNSYKKEFLEGSGLSIFKENKVIDRFRGRVMFPIHSMSGKVLGFGGRTLKTDKKTAKYVNSPESDIYHKSKVLYGIYFAKQSIAKLQNCFLVEGYTDVISMHQAGISNVVASSGTALSLDQIKLIERFTKNITILFDGDTAGIKASFRGIDLILQAGMNVKVVLFPEGEDPDSFAKKSGSEKLQTFVTEEAQDFLSFKTNLLKDEAKSDPIKRVGLIKEVVKSISIIPDAITQAVYISESSKLLQISEAQIVDEIRKTKQEARSSAPRRQDNKAPVQTESKKRTPENKSMFQEKDIIRFLLTYGDHEITFTEEIEEVSEAGNKKIKEETIKELVAKFIIEELKDENIQFSDENYQAIFNTYMEFYERGELPTQQYFIQHQSPEISQSSVDVISSQYALSENWKEHGIFTTTEDMQLKLAVETAVYSLMVIKIESYIQDCRRKLEALEIDEQMKQMEEIHRLLQIKKEISNKLGRTVLR